MRSMLSRRPGHHDPVTPAAAASPTNRSRVLRVAAHGALVLSLVGVSAAFAATRVPDGAQGADSGRIAPAASGELVSRSISHLARASSRAQERAALPREVTIAVDGVQHTLLTQGETLADTLSEAGLVLGGDDQVSVPLTAVPADGASIAVARVTFAEGAVRTELPFATTERPDPTMLRGERAVETAGAPGVEVVGYRARLVDGVEVSREETLRTVVEPVTQVVRVGTKAPAPPPVVPAAPARTGSAESAPAAPAAPAAATGGDPRAIGRSMVAARGWGEDQWACLDRLFTRESNWNPSAQNRSSGAYGIPQALPGTKMATAGADWRTNPATQITWGLNYIAARYGTPCGAWAHSQAVNWY